MTPTSPPAPGAVSYATLAEVVAVPKQADFDALYPTDEPGELTGQAISLNCAARPDGVLTDCRVTGSRRGVIDARFGRATLAISAWYRLRPLTAAELKSWPADKERRIRTSITWSRGASGVTDVPTLPLPKPLSPPPTPGAPVMVKRSGWARLPGGDDLGRYYPDRAQRMNVGGASSVICHATGEGVLELCGIESETPADMNFGEATLRLTRLFRLKPVDGDGHPVEGVLIRIPVVWSVP